MTLEKEKWYEEKREGALTQYGYSIKKSKIARHRALNKAVKRYGKARVAKMLQAQANLRRNKKKTKAAGEIFARDANWVRKQ